MLNRWSDAKRPDIFGEQPTAVQIGIDWYHADGADPIGCTKYTHFEAPNDWIRETQAAVDVPDSAFFAQLCVRAYSFRKNGIVRFDNVRLINLTTGDTLFFSGCDDLSNWTCYGQEQTNPIDGHSVVRGDSIVGRYPLSLQPRIGRDYAIALRVPKAGWYVKACIYLNKPRVKPHDKLQLSADLMLEHS